MNLSLRLAWRNLWRQPKRTWLTTGAMVFSNLLLVFLMSMQVGMYKMMIDNTLQLFAGHLQIQAPGYIDDQKMRQVVPDILALAENVREELQTDTVAARGWTFALASSEDRSYGIAIYGVEADYEAKVSTVPGLVREGRFLADNHSAEVVIGQVLARNLQVGLGDEITIMGSGLDGSFSAAVLDVVGIIDTGVPDLDRSIAEMPIG
ncbi:MAG: ABC transporter permease, partial [Pseudomonadota bacterium]